MIHYFTFGSDHSRHGTSLERCHVTVDAPDDHRAIFMGWRGSNAFSFEYDEHEWVAIQRRYPTTEYARITVTEGVTR